MPSDIFLRDWSVQGWANWANVRVIRKTANENRRTEGRRRHALTPAACIAVSSRSEDSRLNALMDAIRQPIGRVRTKKDGSSRRKVFSRGRSPTPLLIRSSMSRRISRVIRINVSAPRLCANGTPSSCRMYRRSEEHTSELQSQSNLVCRLLLEKKKKKIKNVRLNK